MAVRMYVCINPWNRTNIHKMHSMFDRTWTNSEKKVTLTIILEKPDIYRERKKP